MANILFHEVSFLFLTSENVLIFRLYFIFRLSPTVYGYLKYVPVKKNPEQGRKVDCEAVCYFSSSY